MANTAGVDTVAARADTFLTSTDWAGYQKIKEALAHTRVRITYHRGRLELMTPSARHEKRKSLFGCLVEAYLDVMGLDFECGGSATFEDQELDQGLEPDECYWIASFEAARGDKDLELRPDLALEVEVSRRLVPRLPLLAALEVPEVWRYTRGGQLMVMVLTPGGYVERESSQALPDLSLADLLRHVAMGREQGTSVALRAWRAWLSAP